jgi:hypothetical protein
MTKEAVLITEKSDGKIIKSPLVHIINIDSYILYLYGENLYGAVLKKQCAVLKREVFRVVHFQLYGSSDTFKTNVNEKLAEYTEFRLGMDEIKKIMMSFPKKQPVMGGTYDSLDDFLKKGHYFHG